MHARFMIHVDFMKGVLCELLAALARVGAKAHLAPLARKSMAAFSGNTCRRAPLGGTNTHLLYVLTPSFSPLSVSIDLSPAMKLQSS